ncbi:uncharacterized protein LOC141686070 [Apium graveolens]|uniref:uncharacterized protein LOC141686070 n=1 Tax=Apium graveolens TaxID=4045 RepID=UPI003D795D00
MGRLAAWTIELNQFYIEYKPRTTIKAQVLSDFVVEYQFKTRAPKPDEDQLRPWLLFVDGSSTSDSGGAGIILISPEGFKIQQALKFGFSATNNVAEYEALITGLKLVANLEAESRFDWRQPFLDYIIDDKLPEHKAEARALIFKARNYCVIGSLLYRRALSKPLLRCLAPDEALQAIVEIHTDICGEHLGGNNLALKVIKQGLYRPTVRKDCEDYVKKCQACQFYWNSSVSDKGTQFVGAQFEKSLEDLKIQHIKAFVAYPQANGLSEVTNRTILQGLKKRIEEIPRWVDELPNVLWSYRTTPQSATGETPSRLAYGVDAVLPVEVSLISPRIEVFDLILSLEGLRLHNDLLEETRKESRIRMIAQQEKTARYFNKKVKPKCLKVDDLVLRDSVASQPAISGKFKPTWEGPYRVSKVVSSGTYELSHLDDWPIKNAWNGIHLKKFYQ